mmetsp:Transcript_4064/g.9557  ORF Transcript_4064/g.9557 Transcript_4064/m.9557 type:complete len:216 (+) Transcript_4064:2032-2679(+)
MLWMPCFPSSAAASRLFDLSSGKNLRTFRGSTRDRAKCWNASSKRSLVTSAQPAFRWNSERSASDGLCFARRRSAALTCPARTICCTCEETGAKLSAATWSGDATQARDFPAATKAVSGPAPVSIDWTARCSRREVTSTAPLPATTAIRKSPRWAQARGAPPKLTFPRFAGWPLVRRKIPTSIAAETSRSFPTECIITAPPSTGTSGSSVFPSGA